MVYQPRSIRLAKADTSRISKTKDIKLDLDDIEQLKQYAKTKGLDVKEKKPGLFSRVVDFISRPMYASAGAAKAIIKRVKTGEWKENPLEEAWKGLKAEEKETYSDVLKEAGVKNKWVRGGVGFALDVALDPSTYIGGSLVKGGLKGVQTVGKVGLGATRKFAPRSVALLEMTGRSLKEAVWKAFDIHYGLTKKGGIDVADEVARYFNKLGIEKENIVKNVAQKLNKFDKQTLKEATNIMFENKSLERLAREGSNVDFIKGTGKTSEAVKAMKELGNKIGQMTGIPEDKLYKNYIPSILNLKERLAQDLPSALKVGKEGYLKKFNDLLPKGKRLEDPLELYARRDYEVFRNNLTRNTLKNVVTTYGKSVKGFDKLDEAEKMLWKPIYEKGKPELNLFKIEYKPAEDLMRQITAQKEPFERAMVKVGKGIQDALNEGVPVTATKNLKKFAGAYYPNTNEIKLKYFTPDVLLHERGHSWDFINNRLSKVINTKKIFQKELKTLTDKFYGGTAQQRASAVEKWAVFIDKFIHEPNFVKKNAPMFTAYFRKKLATEYAFKQAYQKASKQIKIIDKTVKNILPMIKKADKRYLKTAVETAFSSKEAVGFGGFKKPIGYLKENDFRYINNYLFPEMKTIDMLAKATGYDGLTRLFKTAVTAYFPAFHIRNFISGAVQNYSVLGAQALNPANFKNGLGILKGTNKIIKYPKWSGTGKDLMKVINEEFSSASRYISDLGDYIEEIGSKGFKLKSKIQKLNPRKVGNFIEMWQKATATSAALKQGKTLKEALRLAEAAGFDYSKITKFESKIMRRIIPFYTFARKNAELQIKTLTKNPERILNQIKFTKNLSEIFGGRKPTEEELKGLPKWALDGLGFKVEGNRYLTQFGLPLEEFTERVSRPSKTTLSSLNQIVKYPLESKLGYDFFRERDLIDINKIAPASGELILEKAPDFIKDIMRIRKVDTDYGIKYYASPKALHILRNIPTTRLQNTLGKMFDDDMNKVDKWLAFLTGARIYDIDIELQKYFTERDLKRDIQDQLLNIGEGKKFEKFYVPKEQKEEYLKYLK